MDVSTDLYIHAHVYIQVDTAIDANTWYSIATSDFMLTGKEKNMGYLNPENPDIRSIQHYTQPDQSGRDVRHAFIGYLDYTKSTVK